MTHCPRASSFLIPILATVVLAWAVPRPVAASTALWVDSAGRPVVRARLALQVLDEAAADGLNPADYGVLNLRQVADQLERTPSPNLDLSSRFDADLTAAMQRYLQHLRYGLVDPRALGLHLPPPQVRVDIATTLHTGVEEGRLAEVVERMRPPLAEYAALRDALARYRGLASTGSGAALPPLAKSIHSGDPYAGVRQLRVRLVSLGDLPVSALRGAEDTVYEGPLVDAVKRFQIRHGLDADGVIGRATWDALSVPVAQRSRQIELAMERLRWLPEPGNQRLIMLNIPMFRLWAWDQAWTGTPSITMKVIVGRANKTETPLISKVMDAVIFRPYWNIPSSILLKEILPHLEKDPDYLRREDMEIVKGGGDDAERVEATAEQIALLRKGVLRLRQRPGPRNALGLVKFVFPNEEHVYLHDTPARSLFARARRDFSHGCVRVENPIGLAEWVFSGEPEWNREQILAAMSDEEHVSRQVRLKQQVQVTFTYTTAAIAPEDGAIHFAADIYKLDPVLDAALRRAGQ